MKRVRTSQATRNSMDRNLAGEPMARIAPSPPSIVAEPPRQTMIRFPFKFSAASIICPVPIVDAARLFGKQKGATPAQIDFLTARLNSLRRTYLSEYGIDVQNFDGSGSAGGLAGGLAALGATLVPGFHLVADEVGLHELVAAADLVITGEGFMDEESFQGKAVGGVKEMANELNKPVVAICGDIHEAVRSRMEAVSLVDLFGEEQAFDQPLHCVEQAATQILTRFAI